MATSGTQLGNDATTNNNTFLRANGDGSFSICKGTAASPTEIFKINANGSVSQTLFPKATMSVALYASVSTTAATGGFSAPSSGATTYTLPTGCQFVRVTVIGGGGGGGGVSASAYNSSAGGGQGGTSIKFVTPSATESCQVGVGGTAGANTGGTGGTGGTTNFGSHCSATGGTGGGGATVPGNISGGIGGSGSSGTVNLTGEAGGRAFGYAAGTSFISGNGGGEGGGAGNVNVAGGAGSNGGGGGGVGTGGSAYAGGAGGQGMIIVEEFYS